MRYCYTTWLKGLVFLAIILLTTQVVFAQVSTLSPYSRFGIGLLNGSGGTVNRGLGGVSSSWHDYFSINADNPATYSYMYNTTFEIGGVGNFLQLENEVESQWLNNASLNDVKFVFKRQGGKVAWGAGLIPFSKTGYSLTDSRTIEDVGLVEFRYDGEGGINKAFLGVSGRKDIKKNKTLFGSAHKLDSAKVNHHVAVGANFNYLFGSLNQVRRIVYDDASVFNTRISSFTSINDFTFDFGVHGLFNLKNNYQTNGKIKNRMNLAVGATYTLGKEFASNFEEITETIRYATNTEYVVDTAAWLEGTEGSINIPSRIGGGLSFIYSNSANREFVFAVDYHQQNWTQFKSKFGDEEETGNLANASDLSFGFQYTPKQIGSNIKALKLSSYRLGFRMSDTYLDLGGNQISEVVATAGISIPLLGSRSMSRFNLGMEFGKKGTTENNLIEENFINAYVGFSFAPFKINQWFIERKYD